MRWVFFNSGPAEGQGRCLTEGSVIRLDSYFDETTDYHYELIAHTTGMADKVTYIKLLKGQYGASSPECIEADKVVSAVDVNWGPEDEADIQWPNGISVTNEGIEIGYTENKSQALHLANLPITWSF